MTRPRKTALEYAAFLLGVRALSIAELRKKMFAKEYEPHEISRVIEDFTRRGYLNDALYAESLCSNLTERGDGKRKIAGKLRTKGIDPELIKEVLQKLDENIPENEAAWQALQRKKNFLLREPELRKRKEKAVRFLAGHGFSAGAAYAAWTRFSRNEED